MDTPHARLKAARVAAGFKSAAQAAEHLGISLSTYNAHENGQNGISVEVAKDYSASFNTTAEWLLLGHQGSQKHSATNIGEKLRRERERRGWSQAYVAEQVQVTRAAVSQWEMNQNNPSLSMLQKLSDLFGMGLAHLLDTEQINASSTAQSIDPLLVETWKRLTPKQRRRLAQIALILAEE